MAEFKYCPRNSDELSGEWRLASVDEVKNRQNLAQIKEKGILNPWETARLLDGSVKEKYNCVKQHNISKMEGMILIKRVQSGTVESTTGKSRAARQSRRSRRPSSARHSRQSTTAQSRKSRSEETTPRSRTRRVQTQSMTEELTMVELRPPRSRSPSLEVPATSSPQESATVQSRRRPPSRSRASSPEGSEGSTTVHPRPEESTPEVSTTVKPRTEESKQDVTATIQSRQLDDAFFEQMYSGVQLTPQGGKAAVLLSCEDKITEAICFVPYRIVQMFPEDGRRKKELNKLTESLEEKFRNGRTVLHYAVDQPHNQEHGRYVAECLKNKFMYGMELIKAADRNGKTALHLAALHGNIKLCEFFMKDCEMKADEKDKNGENLLHYAVKGQLETEIFKNLCSLSRVDLIIHSQDLQGKTALHKAATLGRKDMIDTLIDKTYDKLRFIGQPDLFGQTALLEAAREGHVEAVKVLLQNGSRPLHECNSDGRTALHYAVQLSNDDNAKEMAELVLNHHRAGDERYYEQERSLLLWASATSASTTEEANPESSNVERYLEKERKGTEKSLEQLFRFAIELRHDKIAWDLIKNGANIADIKRHKWYDQNKQHVDDVLNQLKKINNMARRRGDQPAIFDSLGRKEVAEGLSSLFMNPYVKSPVTVGISGEWGMGKSSLMIQTEITLLKMSAQLSFPNILDTEQFRECKQIQESGKVPQAYDKINKAAKKLLPSSALVSGIDPLVQFLDSDYQPKHYEVYKLLALRDHKEMFPQKDDDEGADSSSNQYSLRNIPSILTVRYNAWHYQNEQEAWAGLAIETTKAIEESMTRAQKLRCRCRYSWREHGRKLFLELLLPILLALFLSIWVTWAVWELLTRSNSKDVQALKYGSVPVTVLIIVWTVVRQLLSVLKPISDQIMGYLQLPNHRTNLGYQHQVISDITFLRDEIGEKPSWRWRFIAWLWTITTEICIFIARFLLLCPSIEKDNSVFKSSPPDKDDIRMIVFIDDLDRCQDKVILQVLSAVNLVLVACNINVVLGMDMNMLERVIKGEFPHSDNPRELAEKYIGKMVELQLALPDPNEDELKHFLDQQLGPAFEEGFANEVAESTTPTEQLPSQGQSSAAATEESPGDGQSIAPMEQIRVPQQSSSGHNWHVCLNVYHDIEEASQSCLSNTSGILQQLISSFKTSMLQRIRGRKETKGKLQKMSFSMQTIMPNYIMEERVALDYLRKRVTGARRLPREWKRFLIYHRIAWHILHQRKQVRNEQGWQQQMIIWVFCCWQWKHQIEFIIKNWKRIVRSSFVLKDGYDNDQLRTVSLKSIIVNCYQNIWLPEQYKEKEQEEEEDSEEAESDSDAEPTKEESDEKLELEKEEWLSLIDIFASYDVSMKCLEYFQKFRVHCQVGDLATSLPKETIFTQQRNNLV